MNLYCVYYFEYKIAYPNKWYGYSIYYSIMSKQMLC